MNDYSRITALYAVFPWGMRTGTAAGAAEYRNKTGLVKDKFTVADKFSYTILQVCYNMCRHISTDKIQEKNYCERIDLCKWTEDSIYKVLSADNTWALLISVLSVSLGKNSRNFWERGIVFRRRVVYNLTCIGMASRV